MSKMAIDEQRVIELFAKYDNCRQVAEELGVCDETIRRVLLRHEVKRTGNRISNRKQYIANCAHRDNCYALFRMLFDICSLNSSQIANSINVNSSIVWQACCGTRGKRSRKTKASFDLRAIETEYIAGASCHELGKKYGVRHETISRWMRERGHYRGKFAKKKRLVTCQICGKQFSSTAHNSKFCSKKCFYKSSNRSSDYKKRALRFGVEYDASVTLDAVYKRDGGICYICGSSCDYGDVLPSGAVGNFYPTIDHITALNKGGGHVWGNVKLAHMLCNSIKQDRELTDGLRESIIERTSTTSGENQRQASANYRIA